MAASCEVGARWAPGGGAAASLESAVTRDRLRQLPRADVVPSSGGWAVGVAAGWERRRRRRRRRAAWKGTARAARGVRGVHSAAGTWGREGAGRGEARATACLAARQWEAPLPRATGMRIAKRAENALSGLNGGVTGPVR